MIYGNAGHNPDGKVAAGAVGLIKESTEARKVIKYVKKYIKRSGFGYYDCTIDNGTNQNDVLVKIRNKVNLKWDDSIKSLMLKGLTKKEAVESLNKNTLFVSIHFNSCINDYKGDGVTTGTEVYVYAIRNDQANKVATNVCKQIAKLGFKNRGVKANPSLYVLNSTEPEAILIECCFVDDADDVKLYNAKKMGKAIVLGILNSYSFTVKTTKKGVYLRKKAAKKIKEAGKLGRLPKGSEFKVSKFKIKSGIVFGYTNKHHAWVALTNTKIVD